MTIAEIMRIQPESIQILKKYGLAYLRCRQMQFEEACSMCAANPVRIKEELLKIRKTDKKPRKDLNAVVKTILRQHKQVRKCVAALSNILEAAIENEQALTYELLTIRSYFSTLAESLELHLYKEEIILFPDFIGLWGKKTEVVRTQCLHQYSMQYPIERLESEHESALNLLSGIQNLIAFESTITNGGHYVALSRALKELELQLKKLIHLENNILFKEVMELESQREDSS